MSSKHLVDPELVPALAMLPGEPLSAANLPVLRAQIVEMYQAMSALASGVAGDIECREAFAPGLNGAPPVRMLVYTHQRSDARRPIYFYIHGGGFVLGAPDMASARNMDLASRLGCVVVAVNYRLAPETTFPGNIEDCYAALTWTFRHAAELGGDPQRIAIGGESAGGGLAAALALYTRDRGEVPIVHQQLIYPMLDDRDPVEPHPYAGEFGWTPESNRFGWRCLLGCEPGGPDVSEYAAPARAKSLAGLPPTFIGVGALDLFAEQNLEYARRLMRAGVSVELHVYPGAFHGSDIAADARVSRQHARDQIEALRVAFARVPSQ